MSVNATKSNTMHFRTNSIARMNFTFTCGQTTINNLDYIYFSVTAELVTNSGSRELGLLIAIWLSIGRMR